MVLVCFAATGAQADNPLIINDEKNLAPLEWVPVVPERSEPS